MVDGSPLGEKLGIGLLSPVPFGSGFASRVSGWISGGPSPEGGSGKGLKAFALTALDRETLFLYGIMLIRKG